MTNPHDPESRDPRQSGGPGDPGVGGDATVGNGANGADGADGGHEPFPGDPREAGGYEPFPGGAYEPFAGGDAGAGAQGGPIGEGVRQPGGEEPPQRPVRVAEPSLDVGAAAGYGFKATSSNFGQWLLIGIVIAVVVMIINAAGAFAGPRPEFDPNGDLVNPDAVDSSPASLITSIITQIVVLVAALLPLRGMFELLDGRTLSFSDFFRITDWGRLLLTALLAAVISAVVTLPGLIVMMGSGVFGNTSPSDPAGLASLGGFAMGMLLIFALSVLLSPFYMFMTHLAMDRGLGPVDAFKANLQLVKGNYLRVLGMYVLSALLAFLGMMLCLVGLLFFIPVGQNMLAHGYRQLIGGRLPVDATA